MIRIVRAIENLNVSDYLKDVAKLKKAVNARSFQVKKLRQE